ncbi:MAG: NAD(P)-dependent oxidoreductase [Candidatus Tectomicrobia bacterium]|nr:NAD(P)-dependent oxidoreductase [Candidatus Tectomicrobia bacterium]
MRRALVTGGSGFLGSHIADTLSTRGYAVTLFDTRPSPHLRSNQQMVVGDVLDGAGLEAAAAGCEVIFHLAALADLTTARREPFATARLNILGTINALEAARRAGTQRFMFASTVYVYSRQGGFYRCSKQACEAFIEEYFRTSGLEYTILRYGSLYGPRADERNGVYRLLRQALLEGRIRHVGTPQDSREYVHVEDAARLSVEALAEEYVNQHIIITGHSSTRLADLFTMFSEILGRELEIEYVSPVGEEQDGHYRVTPYAYTPRLGRKLTSSSYVDMGQGILQLLEQLHHDLSSSAAEEGSRT